MFDIGSKIRHFRELKGYSQEDMAKLMGITLKTYSNLERDMNKKVDLDNLQKIAEILGKEVLELMNYGEKMVILNGNTESQILNNNHICLYPSSQALAHEIEKLKSELSFKDKENAFLKKEIENLQKIIRLLENGNAKSFE